MSSAQTVAAAPRPDRTVRTEGGLTLHTWAHGSAEPDPVLLVHGFGSSTLYNWVKTGWVAALLRAGRTVVSADLPGHGESADVDPRGMRTRDIVADLTEQLERRGPAEVHGYSLGSRLSWELAAGRPDLVASLVVGGAPSTDRLGDLDTSQARRWYRTGDLPDHEMTRAVVPTAAALPGQHVPHAVELLLSLAEDPYDPTAAVPRVPTLVVAGEKDVIAADAAGLRDLVRKAGAESEYVSVPGRNHVNVLTSQHYRRAVIDFLSR
ncbi:MAG: alpha/beta fold hydrolase [Nesterenkonia sp.]|nr:alpha/beta fold hydrolase [Nesterenkonia sp.]